MPALVTHHIFANTAADHAPSSVSEAISADPIAFSWGAQGPDILFFHHPIHSNSVSRLGQDMHSKRVADTFSAFVSECAKNKDPSSTAYLLGFCCHYALDRTVHPFVTYMINYRLGLRYPAFSQNALHHLCESELDRIAIEKLYRTRSASFPSHHLLSFTPETGHTASRLIRAAASSVYEVSLSERQVSASMRSMLRIQRILQNPTGRNASRMYSLEKLFHSEGALSSLMRPCAPLPVDCTNQAHDAWFDAATPHMRRYESFFDLLTRAERLAIRLMDCSFHGVQDGSPLPPALFSLNYMGLSEW